MRELERDFLDACADCDITKVKELLLNSELDVNVKDIRYSVNRTALARACFYNNVDVVRELLNCERIDANIKCGHDGCGYKTAFEEAYFYCYPETISELIKHSKVDVHDICTDYYPFDVAEVNRNIVEQLVKDNIIKRKMAIRETLKNNICNDVIGIILPLLFKK